MVVEDIVLYQQMIEDMQTRNNKVHNIPIEDNRRGNSLRLDVPGTTSDRRGCSVKVDISNDGSVNYSDKVNSKAVITVTWLNSNHLCIR